ncbi:DUF2189 domain-containing protein [Paralimibaculum aggregatum]|uniref:DUF2189 domain-containing protein n=1 Tax=Paralimibaculum aggregatum TaxID=3036245 RepID=A0ABQ6LKI0_9RHOB|nr:DUF2189 domain-containing protein [Limibaculum sp. NKW23]GMG81293.1 DUF2189 domain-containing protein [Limibaculum sp. NKW23]
MATTPADGPAENTGPWRESRGMPAVRAATWADLRAALAAGWADFLAAPLMGMTVGLLYAAGGWLLLWVLELKEYRGLSFPVVTGFALIGPFVAVILYEISRRREQGERLGWGELPAMIGRTARKQILYQGFVLMFWLAVWSRVGVMLFAIHFSASVDRFWDVADQIFTTSHGLTFLVVGHLFGAFFAGVAYCLSVIAFPFLLDRDSDFFTAMVLSFRAVIASPAVMLGWAAFLGAALAAACAPAFLGLVVVLPLLGHASWHLYRRLVAP